MTKRDELKAVLKYRDGSFYVGSIAVAATMEILGLNYLEKDLSGGIDRAKDQDVHVAHRYLFNYVQHMRKYPVRECPCCGSIVRVETIAEER